MEDSSDQRVTARLQRKHDQLVADLATHALSGDTMSARAVVGRLLSDGKGGRLVTEKLAAGLARSATDFDLHPIQTLEPRHGQASSAGGWTAPTDLVSLSTPELPTLVLSASVRARIDSLVAERRQVERLKEHNLEPASRILLTGPPGVGKTLTARWLAAELRITLARVEPALVMSSLLGESARNLRRALDWGRQNQCVFFVDEFDAFAKRRDDVSDVGELKRLVNMLLLEIDEWPATTLFVAATNHVQLLDPAVLRRFDVVLDLPLPDRCARRQIVERAIDAHRLSIPPDVRTVLAESTRGMSGSDLDRLISDCVRVAIVNDLPLVPLLVQRVAPPPGRGREETRRRSLFCAVAHDYGGMSNRRIADLLGIANSSVSELVRTGRVALDDIDWSSE